MAPSLSNAKLLVIPVADAISFSLYRRVLGYAAAAAPPGGGPAAAGVGGGGEMGSTDRVVEKVEEKAVIREESGPTTSTWGPDPVTGYYRPGDPAAMIDTAGLERCGSESQRKISSKSRE